jgi:hypothetical protein
LVDSRPQKAPKFGNKRFQQQRFQQQRREREARQEGGREKTKQQQQKRQQWGNWRDQQRVGGAGCQDTRHGSIHTSAAAVAHDCSSGSSISL